MHLQAYNLQTVIQNTLEYFETTFRILLDRPWVTKSEPR